MLGHLLFPGVASSMLGHLLFPRVASSMLGHLLFPRVAGFLLGHLLLPRVLHEHTLSALLQPLLLCLHLRLGGKWGFYVLCSYSSATLCTPPP